MPPTLDVVVLVVSILREIFDAIPSQDLKRKLKSYDPDVTDEKIEAALKQLKHDGLIEILEEPVGTQRERIIHLTGKGLKRSTSAAL